MRLAESWPYPSQPKPAQSTRHAIGARGRERSRDAGVSAVTPPKAASQQAGTG